MTVVTVSPKYQVVIPKDVRARHGLRPGTRLLLYEDEDRLVLVPRAAETETVERGGILVFRGTLSGHFPDHRELRSERIDRLAGRS